ncbi:DUF2480 family protein [Lutimonas zeaxanthinifaciens]|uniref:DUF2480 family protein n=1 Tax=Lutimonas zeaxanthinifaciens TaxID=3060215 RepID=UPI00265C9252|nr:DUF2480 family protein [Lutimonas sp. YSD2104]WKK65951.1 DUF2480 family protein [Lutimonas sp. YSD2104]
MSGEIVNRVAKSKLITIDLEDLYPEGRRVRLDISEWLFEGLILREKDFRESVKQHNWDQYHNCYVALHCSTDAIIPSWAYFLISVSLSNVAKKCVVGDLELLESILFNDIIKNFSVEQFKDRPVIVKGCSDKRIPESAYVGLCQKLVPVVSSLMFGEACSSVPLFKKKK